MIGHLFIESLLDLIDLCRRRSVYDLSGEVCHAQLSDPIHFG
jgi:hypothetical protein